MTTPGPQLGPLMWLWVGVFVVLVGLTFWVLFDGR